LANLQRAIASRWSNVVVPIKPDTEATDKDWKPRHLLLVGQPEANAAASRAGRSLPVAFGPASITLKGDTYAHPGTALIVACENPVNPRYAVVLIGGLGAESTWHAVEKLGSRGGDHPEVVLFAKDSPPWALVARSPEKEKDKKVAVSTRE
jgi:hypothetical protein